MLQNGKSAIRGPFSTLQNLNRVMRPVLFTPIISRRGIIDVSRAARTPVDELMNLMNEVIEPAVRQELGLQSNKIPKDTFQRVEKAILNCKLRATVGEIAAASGLRISETEEALRALAYDSQANLQVSAEGDVVYSFSQDFQTTIRNKSFSLRLRPLVSKIQNGLSLLVRISFGSALFVSILVTFLAILAILSSSSGDSKDDKRNNNRRDIGGSTFINFSDVLFIGRNQRGGRKQEGDLSLPEAIFSFVFGDGDPNENFEEYRWQGLAHLIQRKRGVVTAEEMAPFLDPSPEIVVSMEERGFSTDDAFVLPALIKFEGEPFVDEEGHLLYRFPSLQTTVKAAEYLEKGYEGPFYEDYDGYLSRRPTAVYEKVWNLTSANSGQIFCAKLLGALNIFGVIWLGYLLSDPLVTASLLREGRGFIIALFPALIAYAGTYFAIPSIRNFQIKSRNRLIRDRNKARRQALQVLSRPRDRLSAKLASARKEGVQKEISKEDIVYSTDESSLEKEQSREKLDWDDRLETSKAANTRSSDWG
ncbi:hypothetical protein CEUSTIGMA_g1670.t1 [Chlamydomonas eustigma]|uniref:Iron-sulfur cluster biosynthesis family protein n=1 Tax=Chlamydomonas eustigma TaxID=1157962 RepID=A0A250WTS6_9CHLO|nr:hypothetical protein CEUSTIGMA_g1670.t1 [Chlamydomonas eustigma]|eukprot:GAX74221.1 hypothetical protein CEUSTIGMA_g1670.t1 [Chlamydomonas eustigma]